MCFVVDWGSGSAGTQYTTLSPRNTYDMSYMSFNLQCNFFVQFYNFEIHTAALRGEVLSPWKRSRVYCGSVFLVG